jgi:hypothetical protein
MVVDVAALAAVAAVALFTTPLPLLVAVVVQPS